jgi:hypothetical protein
MINVWLEVIAACKLPSGPDAVSSVAMRRGERSRTPPPAHAYALSVLPRNTSSSPMRKTRSCRGGNRRGTVPWVTPVFRAPGTRAAGRGGGFPSPATRGRTCEQSEHRWGCRPGRGGIRANIPETAATGPGARASSRAQRRTMMSRWRGRKHFAPRLDLDSPGLGPVAELRPGRGRPLSPDHCFFRPSGPYSASLSAISPIACPSTNATMSTVSCLGGSGKP